MDHVLIRPYVKESWFMKWYRTHQDSRFSAQSRFYYSEGHGQGLPMDWAETMMAYWHLAVLGSSIQKKKGLSLLWGGLRWLSLIGEVEKKGEKVAGFHHVVLCHFMR